MDEFLTEFLVKEIEIGKTVLAPLDILLLVGMTVSGVMLRSTVSGYTALPWYEPYLLYAGYLKAVSYIFDWALAVLLAVLVCSLTGHKIRAFLAYGITFVLPVFVSGSAMWGMGDSVYLFFLLLSFGLLLKGKYELSLCLYGLSVFLGGFALFLLPLYVLLYLQGRVKWYEFFSPLAGVVLRTALTRNTAFVLFAFEQSLLRGRGEKQLSYNCPNLFYLIGTDKFVFEYEKVAAIFSIGLVLVLLAVLLTKQIGFKMQELSECALFLCLFLPYTLPGMNERSFLPACLIALLYGFICINRFYLPIVLTTITYISYSAYFRGESAVPLTGVSFVVLALIIHVVDRLRRGYAEG